MPVADVAVIGAGVVGCAIARRFTLEGARVALLERGADLLSGASKANSAILHTGFDAPPDSVELECMQSGYAEYLAIRESFNLPLLETGAMVVAWSEAERTALDGIEAQARRNGVNDIRRLTAAEIRAREPELSPRALEALLVPGEHIIDPWSPFLAYTLQAKTHGAEIAFATEVVSGAFDGDVWTLRTNGGAGARGRSSIAPGFMATSWTRAFSEPHRFRSGRERVNSSSSTRRRQSFSARSSCRCHRSARRVLS